MTVVIACPMCQQKIRAPRTVVGRQIRCPQCKNAFIAQDLDSIPAPASPKPARPRAASEPQAFAFEEPVMSAASEFADQGVLEDGSPVEPAPAPRGNNFVDYLLMRRMITPAILVVVFYLGVLAIIGSGLFYCVTGLITLRDKNTAGFGVLMALLSLILVPVNLILWRIFCEVLITLFRILDNVREINEHLKNRS